MIPPKAFVTGITGTQGGAVAQQLLSHGWTVTSLTRDATTATAKALAATSGITLTPGNWDDTTVLQTALSGCTAVFMALMPDKARADAELVSATNILNAARAAGTVKTVVCSTGMGVQDSEWLAGWSENLRPYLLGKANVEKAVRAAPAPEEGWLENYTIIRPGVIMQNFLGKKASLYSGLADKGVWTTALQATSKLPLLDAADIGKFAAAAMENPGKFTGKEINLGGDVKTLEDIVSVLSQVAARPLDMKCMSDEEIEVARKEGNIMVQAAYNTRNLAKYVNKEEIEGYGIRMGTFEAFLEREAEGVRETYGR